jgi:hypothetical protein
MVFLGWCANALHLGWTQDKAFQVAEATVIQSKDHGIRWNNQDLNSDIMRLLETA